MKKFFAVSAAVLAAASLFAFAGCKEDGSLTQGGIGGGAGTQAEAGAKNAYALGAVTTASLLAGSVTESASLAAIATEESAPAEQVPEQGTDDPQQTDGQTGEQMREEVEGFNEYFHMLDSFLDEGALRTTVTENSDTSYPFAYKLTVEGKDIAGNTVVHTMYYTETEIAVREEHDDDEHETSAAYDLTGVMEMEGISYTMTGRRVEEVEREGREEETSGSLWIMASDPNSDRYVRMDLEIESEQEGSEQESEREYVYSVYDGGKLLERTSVSFGTESEDGGTETEYELSILKDGARSYFEVERMERVNGMAVIGVKYRTAQGSGRFVVQRTGDEQYTYVFDDGSRLGFDD